MSSTITTFVRFRSKVICYTRSNFTNSEEEKPPEKRPRSIFGETDGSYECPICLENVYERQPTTTICGHVFCGDCIETALTFRKRCPICYRTLNSDELTRLYV